MIVVLDNIRSAYNVGSILRTCDALGIKEVYFCGLTPDPKNPKVLKTSLGAEKNIRGRYFESTKLALETLRVKGVRLVALEISGDSDDIGEVSICEPFALIVGNEISGVSNDILEICDKVVHIPMKGIKESLNVSVAFGIAAYILLSH